MTTEQNALNSAVKNKEIGKLKSNGLKPVIYYNLNCKARAIRQVCA